MANLPVNQRRGLALPATRGNGGYFASRGPGGRAWGDLLLALFVPRGTRPMRRDYGSGLQALLFDRPAGGGDTVAESDAAAVQYVAAEAVARMVPYVRLGRVTVARAGGKLRVNVAYAAPGAADAPGVVGALQEGVV